MGARYALKLWILVSVLWGLPAQAAITCTGTSFPFDTPTNPQAQDYTVPTVTNGVTFAHIAVRNAAREVTAITIGGTNVLANRVGSLLQVTSITNEAFYLKSATAGTNSVSVTWDSVPLSYVLTMITCEQVDQTTPIASSNTATGTTGTTATVDCSSAAGQLVVDFVAVDGNGGGLTAGSGQTMLDQDISDATLAAGSSYEAGATTVTMSHTFASNDDWATICAALTPASSGSAFGRRRIQ